MLDVWTSLALSNATLACSSLFGVFLLSQGYRATQQKAAVFCALLAFVLVAIISVQGTLITGFAIDCQTSYDMMVEAGKTLAPPAMATAIASLCWQKQWQKQNLWRGLMGLMAGYELARYTGHLVFYLNSVSVLSLAFMLVATFSSKLLERTSTIFLAVAAMAYALSATAIGTQGQLDGFLRQDLHRYLLALGNLFCASAMFMMLKKELRIRSC